MAPRSVCRRHCVPFSGAHSQRVRSARCSHCVRWTLCVYKRVCVCECGSVCTGREDVVQPLPSFEASIVFSFLTRYRLAHPCLRTHTHARAHTHTCTSCTTPNRRNRCRRRTRPVTFRYLLCHPISLFCSTRFAQLTRANLSTLMRNSQKKRYRQALAASPDHSVWISSIGFTTNLEELLASTPDSFSPLGGRALVEAKVKGIAWMGGRYVATHRP